MPASSPPLQNTPAYIDYNTIANLTTQSFPQPQLFPHNQIPTSQTQPTMSGAATLAQQNAYAQPSMPSYVTPTMWQEVVAQTWGDNMKRRHGAAAGPGGVQKMSKRAR